MRSNEQPDVASATGKLSLILPLTQGTRLDQRVVAEYRRLLTEEWPHQSVEVIISSVANGLPTAMHTDDRDSDGFGAADLRLLETESDDWSALARAGLSVATGDHLVVLDLERHYVPHSLSEVLEPVVSGTTELAVAVPQKRRAQFLGIQPVLSVLGLASKMVLGSSDVFSGLFVLHRSLWERGGRSLVASGSSLVLELLLRRPSGCVDVPVPVDPRFRPQRFQLQDLRPLKHVLDGRYGSFSRLIQFCVVGASGMVVDLSFYALFQWLLSFTSLVSATSKLFGSSYHLALAAALSISIALLWNFTLNRRLTFNDARGGSWIRQFLTYALSNAVAIALSFTVRLYLPAHVAFFGRHRLAAAVVGIVAATGISFSMSRWIVFTHRSELTRAPHVTGQPQVSPPSVLA
jgi:dolichol-phosphate mannosyltransferase